MDKQKLNTKLIILVIQTALILAGVIVAYSELRNIKIVTSGNLTLELYKDIRSNRIFEANPKIINAISYNKPILKDNGGALEEEDVDNYLNLFEWIAAANESDILSDDIVYNFHGDLILNTYSNKEIKNYIKEVREEDKRYYQRFLDLVDKMQKIDEQKVD